MENFNQVFTLLSKSEGIGLNLDILETGLINIIALVAILIYTVGDFLKVSLAEREASITKSVTDAEQKLKDADWSWEMNTWEAGLVYSMDLYAIKQETRDIAKAMYRAWKKEVMKGCTKRYERAVAFLGDKEQEGALEVKQQVCSIIVTLLADKVKTVYSLENKDSHSVLIDKTIASLEGDSL
jgi:F0F1-type ATP synthase membrane subunit b/b'